MVHGPRTTYDPRSRDGAARDSDFMGRLQRGLDDGRIVDEFPSARVGDVSILLRDDGTNRRARLGLDYVSGVARQRFSSKPNPTYRADGKSMRKTATFSMNPCFSAQASTFRWSIRMHMRR